MKRNHRSETFYVAAIILLLLGFWVRVNSLKRPWQIEFERMVKQNLPIGSSRARINKVAMTKNWLIREPNDHTIKVHVSALRLKNQMSGWNGALNDAVAMDIYLDSENKITGHSSAYGARITMP